MRRAAEAFERRGTRVMLVTFGKPDWVRMWRRETGCPFEILLDPERAAYRAFGLERSALRLLDRRTLARYARHLLAGRLPPRKRGDALQMGGDFLVDASGIVRYSHPSRNPSDRPPVEELIEALDSLPGEGR